MRHMHFMVLTGHLDDYSLPGLIKMLHGQRKTGRLQIDYAESPATFYFEDGRLVDARIGDLRGLEAVYVALSLAGASFNFNPLIKPPERTVREGEQKLIQGLLDAPSGGGASNIPHTVGSLNVLPLPATAATASLLPADGQPALSTQVEERLMFEVGAALAAHSKRFGRERVVYATVIAALLLFTIISGIRNSATITNVAPLAADPGVATPAEIARSSETTKEHTSTAGRPATAETPAREQPPKSPDPNIEKRVGQSDKHPKTQNASAPGRKDEAKIGRATPTDALKGRMVKVLLRVERGRVIQAVVQQPHSGMESYEALALRIARQRQYPTDFSGRDVLELKVKP
ncbi:MAG: hypothetical protein QOG71_3875 [Pyrinomonadaceae bacterium]|nr:hypothetical protein [Pyrinomonadaceae bacterium]